MNGPEVSAFEAHNPVSLLLAVLPTEIHFHVVSFLTAKELIILAQTCKALQGLANHPAFWKQAYLEQWLKGGDQEFIEQIYPSDFDWKGMYKMRTHVEGKYLTPEDKDGAAEEEWKKYFKRGNQLCKYETEDLDEFLLLSSIEQEEYISSTATALKQKDKVGNKNFADIYYFWGRCIKDLSRGKSGRDKYQLLLAEEDKYKRALEADPTDSYVAYSWAINLRFQLEYAEGEDASTLYRASQRMYKTALKHGYTEKYIKWGLGSLKLHMARKEILSNNLGPAAAFLDKAEKKYAELQQIWEVGDILTQFSLCFNYSCIYATRAKIHELGGNDTEAKIFLSMCTDRLQDCAQGEFRQYLTLDLLDLWYFDDFRKEPWFKDIYSHSQPKKLNAPY